VRGEAFDPSEERKAQGLPVLGEVLAKVRKLLDERERRNDPEWQLTPGEKLRRELYNAPDHQAFLAREAAEQERKAQELAASYAAAQERYRQKQAEQAEQESEPECVSTLPRPVSIAEVARQAQERAFAEANREQPDFIDRICGPGSDKPSGRANGGKLGFMG
jgi:cell pole-organizing protein PopZ